MPRYMILMHEDDNAWARLDPEEQRRLLKKYYAWVESLRSDGVFEAGSPVSSQGRVLKVVDGELVDGPFAETQEVLTGYFIVTAEDLSSAAEIARGCPALEHGETVMVRALDSHE